MNVLVISPHMDDETLGAGGTLLKLVHEGHDTHWLNISNVKESYGYNKEYIDIRNKQKEKVANYFGFSSMTDLELEPTKLYQYDLNDMIDIISKQISKIEPELLILPFYNDVHSDHKNVFEWCLPVTKSFRYPYIKNILMMEIISETDFSVATPSFEPNYYVDISDYFEDKLKITNIYEDQFEQYPFPRSVEGITSMAQSRGVVAGTRFAEAFQVLKMIDK